MPLQQCTVDGHPGWKWGASGTCYTGKQGKAKAMRQASAIKVSQASTKSASTVKAKKAPAKKRAAAKKKSQ